MESSNQSPVDRKNKPKRLFLAVSRNMGMYCVPANYTASLLNLIKWPKKGQMGSKMAVSLYKVLNAESIITTKLSTTIVKLWIIKNSKK